MYRYIFLLPVLIITGCTSDNSGTAPEPTKTVYVPVPESGVGSGSQSGINSNLDEIKQSNCKLAQDLLWQSIELEKQGRDLESQAYALGNYSDLYLSLKQQSRDLLQQSINLSIQSSQLRSNC